METLEAIHGRRTVRSFEARPLDRELIEALVWDAAQAPPPAVRGVTRWAFVVVEGTERLADFGAHARDYARARRPEGPGSDWLDNPDFKVFWDAPVLILICRRRDAPESEGDCFRAGQNLMVSAHARGLGTCWVGAPMAWLRSEDGASDVGIPDGFEAVAPILVGYPKATPAPREIPRPPIVWRGG